MKQFEIAHQILLRLVRDEVPFALVLRQTFKKMDCDPVTKSNITALLGCELRHHLIFDNLMKRFIEEDIDFAKTIYLRFYLSNLLFLRRFEDDELLKLAIEELDEDSVMDLVKFVKSTNEIIPEEYDKASPEYLSLRYNTPAWIIRMWQKQYGKGLVFKVLKVNYRASIASLRLRTKEITVEEFLGKHPDYSVAPVSDMVLYQGRGNAKSLEELKEHKIFFMKMGTKYVLDQLELSPLKSLAIYSETLNNIFLDINARFGDDYPIDFVINHSSAIYDARKLRTELGLDKLYLYESNSEGLLTCLSKKVDTFICVPKNSMLDLLRSTPDYFLYIKQNQLDELIANETKCLEDCAKFVAPEGQLVYMIPTLSRKESNSLIANFLVSHPEFSLIEEQQLFPFDSYDSCLYYARMKRNGE